MKWLLSQAVAAVAGVLWVLALWLWGAWYKRRAERAYRHLLEQYLKR